MGAPSSKTASSQLAELSQEATFHSFIHLPLNRYSLHAEQRPFLQLKAELSLMTPWPLPSEYTMPWLNRSNQGSLGSLLPSQAPELLKCLSPA